jgi:hypothetical protein
VSDLEPPTTGTVDTLVAVEGQPCESIIMNYLAMSIGYVVLAYWTLVILTENYKRLSIWWYNRG